MTLQLSYARDCIASRAKLPSQLCLEKSRQLAKQRIQEMVDLFARFEQETFGYF
jgi:hypothetical protein